MTKTEAQQLEVAELKLKRTRLIRLFALASLLSLIAAAAIFGFGYQRSNQATLLSLGQQANLAVSSTLRHHFNINETSLGPQNIDTELDSLRAELSAHIRTSPIYKVVLFNSRGRAIMSTSEKSDLDATKAHSNEAIKAIDSRAPVSEVNHMPESGITAVASYIPLFTKESKSIFAVLEIYQDISSVVAVMEQQRTQTFVVSAVALFLITLILTLMFRSADKLLLTQTNILESHLLEVQTDNEELEKRVVTRTRELQQIVAELEDHKAHLEEIVDERTHDLARARDQALEANKTKSAFLANMSHELRTPLNAIIGYSEILAEEADEMGVNTLTMDIHKINTAGKHLLSLINDILDISKIEAGKMENYIEQMNVERTISEVVDSIQPLIRQNSNQLKTHVESDIQVMETDITKFRQILFNLISNANKFTENGLVEVNLNRMIDDSDRAWICMEVRDNGIGMTSEQQRALFEAFSQADSSTTRKYGGTGLGLAISRRLCELLGGTIHVASELQQGSTFTVHLPEKTPRNPQQDNSRWMAIGPKVNPEEVRFYMADGSRITRREKISTVLVIDDDANIRDLMERFLTRQGFKVHSAANAYEGMELAHQIQPDVITLDVMMPEKDGWSLLTELKRDKELSHIPVIMLTLVEDREVGYALGAADYLQKPIDRNELAETINKHIRPAHQAVALLIQPDPLHSKNMRTMLQKEGLHVIEAANGQLALARIQFEKPDLVFAELNMPGMSGLEFADRLAQNPEWKEIPVVMLTAQSMTEDEREKLTRRVEHVIYSRDAENEIMEEIHTMIIDTLRIEEQHRKNKLAAADKDELPKYNTGGDK